MGAAAQPLAGCVEMHRKRVSCVAGGGTGHKNRMVVVVNPWNVVDGGHIGAEAGR